MKNKKVLLLFAIALFFIFLGKVNAECGVIEKNEIKTRAANIRVTYVPQLIENKDGSSNRVVDIKIYNVSSDVFLSVQSTGQYVSTEDNIIDYRKIGADGAITLRVPSVTEISEYTVQVYTNGANCSGEIIKNIKVTVPKYNFYSQLEACDGISEFYLCQEYITFNIDKSTFYNQTAAYKKKKENPETADLISNDTYKTHKVSVAGNTKVKYIIVGVVIAIGVAVTIYILKKNKNKKVDNEIW